LSSQRSATLFLLPAKRHHFPGCSFGPHFLPKAALRPGVIFASLASPDAFPGIATWAVLAQSCVPRCFSGQWLFPAISVFSQALSGLPQRSANIGSSDGSSLTVTLNQKVSVVFAFDDE
jgi:hypothetical protein